MIMLFTQKKYGWRLIGFVNGKSVRVDVFLALNSKVQTMLKVFKVTFDAMKNED